MTPKNFLPLLLAALCTLLPACDKPRGPAPAPPASPTSLPVAAEDWPKTPSGPMWEVLNHVPAGMRGTVGVVDYETARRDHEEWAEGGHDRNAEEFEHGIVTKFGIRPGEVLAFAWAEITFQDDGERDTYLIARISTDPDKLRAALRAAAFETSAGPDEIWRPTLEKDLFVPQRILLKDNWLVRTLGGDAAIAKIARVWSGQDPDVRSLPHSAALVAALPQSLPAVLRFGTSDQPIEDSPLRVIAMSLAPDLRTGEDVVAVAFNDEAGPDKMVVSEAWKTQIEALRTAPKVDRRGRYLRLRSRPDADPAVVERRKQQAMGALETLKSALKAWKSEKGSWPERLDALWTVEPTYTKNPGCDPWGHRYFYHRSDATMNDPYDLRSLGPDGKENTEDDIF